MVVIRKIDPIGYFRIYADKQYYKEERTINHISELGNGIARWIKRRGCSTNKKLIDDREDDELGGKFIWQ